ncbi:MAG: acyl transferase [Bacteroidota bacterium]
MSGLPEQLWLQAKEIDGMDDFQALALKIFRYQSQNVPVYREFLQLCGFQGEPNDLSDIPFMPVEFFKSHKVHDAFNNPELVFTSSGTTGMAQSSHYISDPGMYHDSFRTAFVSFYGEPDQFCILALLPGYLERNGSSLVYMMEHLIRESWHPYSGFYLDQYVLLAQRLLELNQQGIRTVLVGVSFALLDFFEQFPMDIPGVLIMETGGMKGRRKEIVREELHQRIIDHSGVTEVHSEYGMTELLSQAYSQSKGIFKTPPWLRIFIRELHSPFGPFVEDVSGLVNVVDLANIHSCSFLATKDLGRKHSDGSFEVLGRMDESDIRGCNLMV